VESTTTKMQNSVLEVCQVVNSLAVPPEANCISAYLEVMKKLLLSYKWHYFGMISFLITRLLAISESKTISL
jgi:hypothetical protein